MIWKQASFEEELFEGMQKAELDAVAEEEQQSDLLILQAMEALNAAAQAFESCGRTERAKEVTQVMMSLAEGEEPKSKKSSKDDVKKVFMFFGFSPEDLEGIDLSGDGAGDSE